MATQIYLVRHGVTDWNCEGRAQGHTDIPLNAEGVRQAEAAAARLAGERWDALYSSPLMRAKQTAEALARRTGQPVHVHSQLIERDMGQAEGTTLTERGKRWPGLPWKSVPGVESDAVMAARARQALLQIAEAHPGQRVLCFAHGGLIATFLHSLVPPGATPLHQFHQRNTAITPVRFADGMFVQEGPSDHAHILEDGIEFSAEKGRLPFADPAGLVDLLGHGRVAAQMRAAVDGATAVESAWHGDRLVALVRCFTDGVLHGYYDLQLALPGYEHLLPRLIRRLSERYPDVIFTAVSPALERAGD